jgi:ribosomal protein S18 acetylase RimI-like enzyme
MTGLAVSIDPARRQDLAGVLAVHRDAFPRDLNTKMGRPYLERMYGFFLDHSADRIFLVARAAPDVVAGFVVGARLPFERDLSRDLLVGAAGAVARRPSLLFAPQILGRAAERLSLTRREAPSVDAPEPQVPDACFYLYVVAVGPGPGRGTGIGRGLVSGFEGAAASRGGRAARLSVHRDNDVARRLYERQGWAIESTRGDAVIYGKALECRR